MRWNCLVWVGEADKDVDRIPEHLSYSNVWALTANTHTHTPNETICVCAYTLNSHPPTHVHRLLRFFRRHIRYTTFRAHSILTFVFHFYVIMCPFIRITAKALLCRVTPCVMKRGNKNIFGVRCTMCAHTRQFNIAALAPALQTKLHASTFPSEIYIENWKILLRMTRTMWRPNVNVRRTSWM